MNHSIDKHQIIITQDTDNYTLLAGLPRDGGEFESHHYWSCVNNLKDLELKLHTMDVNDDILQYEEDATTGSIVETECGDVDVIKWIRWKNNWYITDIIE